MRNRLGRYGFAVAAVVAGLLLRRTLEAWVGPGLPSFITFYPLVMVTALVAGLGPGLLATALTMVVVTHWVLAPTGQFAITVPVERVALALFGGMGVIISGMAEVYRRSRRKAVDYDRELALREGEDRLRFALETSHTGAWDLDLVDHTAYRSLEHDRIFGYSDLLPQWTYEMFLDHVLPEDRPVVDAKFRQATETQGDWSFECRIRRVDGEIRWIWAAGRHRVDATGTARRMAGIVHDITERKRAEEALAQAKQEWERTFDSVPDLIAILDTEHRIVRVNRAMAERLNKTLAECVGLHCYEHVHGCSSPIEGCPHRLTVADGLDHSAEVYEERMGGFFLVTTSPLRDAEGRLVGAVHVARDITARKRAEEAVGSIALFPEQDPSPVLRVDAAGGLLYANPAARLLAEHWRMGDGEGLPDPLADAVTAALADGSAREVEIGVGDRRILFVLAPIPKRSYVNLYGWDGTELKAAQEREQEALAFMAASRAAVEILEAMGEGVLLLDMKGRIRSINPALQEMTGMAGGQAIGRPLRDLLPEMLSPGDQAIVAEAVRRARKGHTPSMPSIDLLSLSGRLIPVIPAVSFVRGTNNEPTGIVVTLRDISEIRAAQKSLEESERKYRELVENANSIILRITPEHTITFFNEYAQEFFGYTAAEVLGRNVVGTIVPEVDSEGRDLRGMVGQITTRPELYASKENENMRKDGRRVWVHWANRAVRDDRGNVVEILCVGTDITLRRELEAEARLYQQRLRELTERLAAAEEEDRWRISRYIHDTIIQNLSLSSTRLGSMTGRLAEAGLNEEIERLHKTRRLIDQAIDECRMVMSDLTPALLYELGLIPALNDLSRQVSEKHGMRVGVEDDGQPKPMENPLRGLVFESIRELIMNAVKHAGECEVRVAVTRSEDELVVHVADNGRGFDASLTHKRSYRHGGFGLFSIRQRIEGLGGQMEIQSAAGSGTIASIRVPLSEEAEE